MEFLKCSLYIVGSAGIGKSFFRRALDEFIHSEKRTPMDKFNGQDWIIRAESGHIEVEIKEYRSFDFPDISFKSKDGIFISNKISDTMAMIFESFSHNILLEVSFLCTSIFG